MVGETVATSVVRMAGEKAVMLVERKVVMTAAR